MSRCARVFSALGLLLLSPTVALAQLSPGKLSAVHESLEGVRNCTSCHAIGQGIAPERCLDCHEPLAARIAAKAGLHRGDAFTACEDCHHDHQGRDFDLVWWGEGGKESFDHEGTGVPLTGAHVPLACERCHKASFITNRAELLRHGKNLDRTFLGLTNACNACHATPHREQLSSACETCHTTRVFKPAESFDHDTAAFRLTGRHVEVACVKCHDTRTDAEGAFVRYVGLSYGDCASCHTDPHAGRLAGTCASCHATSGWRDVAGSSFDHAKTRFPLLGRHATIACTACHGDAKRTVATEFDDCHDCHADVHRAGATATAQLRCERCHSVDGFTPARYTMDDHAASRYPLTGAHLAVPCIDCHQRSGATEPFRLLMPADRCSDCHANPHGIQASAAPVFGTCESCHTVERWSRVTFDHGRTDFPLDGKHSTTACRTCHIQQTAAVSVPFDRAPQPCEACHDDAHRAQFAGLSGEARGTACDRCHTAAGWAPTRFDHNDRTRFALEGKHRGVPCASCHPVETDAAGAFRRFRPIGTACENCHATDPGAIR